MQKPGFRDRFIAALPDVPPELDLRLDEFVSFDREILAKFCHEDAALLAEQGLPCDAPPFLNFDAYSVEEIRERTEIFGLPSEAFPIGNNGSGDMIAIDINTRHVIYFNHDFENLRVFINSNLPLFLECLCIFQEHLTSGNLSTCLATIARADPSAALPGTMWHQEVGNQIACDE
jgi:hypothetical protein